MSDQTSLTHFSPCKLWFQMSGLPPHPAARFPHRFLSLTCFCVREMLVGHSEAALMSSHHQPECHHPSLWLSCIPQACVTFPARTLASALAAGGHVIRPACCSVCGRQHYGKLGPRSPGALCDCGSPASDKLRAFPEGKEHIRGWAVTTLELPVAFQGQGRNLGLRVPGPHPRPRCSDSHCGQASSPVGVPWSLQHS